MSLHAIAGLVALNVSLLGVGVSVLFLVRGWRSWGELVRLVGVAYMLGVAAMGIAWVWELVAGIDMSLATILITEVAISVGAAVAGSSLGRRLPPRPVAALPRISPRAAILAVPTVVYFEALFRSGRLAGLEEYDAWAFWVPKAKAIYYFGGLDKQFFHELVNQSYPPLVPALEAAAFHFMGSVDVVTIHLQFWFLLVGFVAALVGLLSERVRAPLFWPVLLLLLVSPHVVTYAVQPQADFLLDEFLAIGAVLIGLWLLDNRVWQLATGSLMLAAAMLTKREGYAFAACIFVAALVVSFRSSPRMWSKVIAAGFAAAAAPVPWRIWLFVEHLGGGAPPAGGTELFAHLGRAWPSLRLALSTLFDFDIWLILVPIALVSIAIAFASGARRLPAYAALVFILGVASLTWTTWAFPSLVITEEASVNPIARVTGALTLLLAALAPLLLGSAWRRADPGSGAS